LNFFSTFQRNSALGYISPSAFERQMSYQQKRRPDKKKKVAKKEKRVEISLLLIYL